MQEFDHEAERAEAQGHKHEPKPGSAELIPTPIRPGNYESETSRTKDM